MNKIVDGRDDKPPPRLRAVKPACDHFAIRSKGKIICRDCEAVWNLGLDGAVWVDKDA